MDTKMQETLNEWLENLFWRQCYETAPSEKCRELIALEFMYSDDPSDETLRDMECVEETLGLEDWQHLYRYCGNNPRKKMIYDRIIGMGGIMQ